MRKHTDKRDKNDDKKNSAMQGFLGNLPQLEFLGNREVVVEGAKGVLLYSEEAIRVNTSIGLLCFEGRGLNLKCISSSELIIDGFITKVEFVV